LRRRIRYRRFSLHTLIDRPCLLTTTGELWQADYMGGALASCMSIEKIYHFDRFSGRQINFD